MRKEKLLAIDFGSSKTVALFFDQEDSLPQEFFFGTPDLIRNATFNFERAGFYFNKILERFDSAQKLKKCRVLISLPAKAFAFKHEVIDLKKIKKEIIKNNKKNEQCHVAEPLVNKHNLLKGWLPLLEKKELTGFFKIASDFKLLRPEFFYGFYLFNHYTRAKNYYLINLGGKTTEVLFFSEGVLDKIKVFDIGGEHFISDICSVLGISAEDARKKFFSFSRLFDSFVKKECTDILTGVIDARAKELLNLLKKELLFAAEAIYLTGGLANLSKLPDFLGQYLGCRAINLNENDQWKDIITQQAYLLSKKAGS